MLLRALGRAAAIWLVPLAFSPAALAQGSAGLERAVALYQDGALPEARGAFDAALHTGGLAPADLARVHWHLGVLQAITGEATDAERSFVLALSVDPELEVPRELPPEGQAIFERARARSEAAALEADASEALTLPHALPVRFSGDAALADQVRVTIEGTVRTVALGPLLLRPEDFGEARERELRLEALDAHGNVSATAEVVVRRRVAEDPGLPPIEEAPPGRGWVVGVVVGAVVVVAAVVLTAVLLTREEQFRAGPPVLE